MSGVSKKFNMASHQLLTVILLLGLTAAVVEGSNSDISDSESISDLSRSPSPGFTVKYYSPRRANIQPSPVELIRTNSGEPLLKENQRRRGVYDPQIFLPLGMDNIRNVIPSSEITSSDVGLTALEDALKPDTVELSSEDQNLVVKTVAAFLLAILFLLFYNGVFLHLF